MKKIVTLLVVFIIAFSFVLPAGAENGKVTYDGKAKEFIFEPGSEYSPTDLFPNFKDVMPGDTLVQNITVKNTASPKVKVKIYMRSLGAHKDSIDFLSKMNLKVQKSSNNEMAYMFDANADEMAQLADWVCLGTLYSGGVVNLDVILNVPTELDNMYKKQIGYLDWEFKVEEFPVEDGDPKPPETGDNTNIGVWFALMIAFAFILILILFLKKKEKKETTKAA